VPVIVDRVLYEHGKRCGDVRPLVPKNRDPSCFVWTGLFEPSEDELEEVAAEFGLHPLAVEDALHAHQRPKLERYGDSWFVVLKTVEYVDSEEVIKVGEVMLFVGAHFLVSVRHGRGGNMATIRKELEGEPEFLARGPWEVVHTLADRVVDEYEVVMANVENDIDEIQVEVFSDPRAAHAARIFKLKREVLEFRQAVLPLTEPMEKLSTSSMSPIQSDQRAYFRDVHDHLRRVSDRLVSIDDLLSSALNANVAQVGMRQNEDMRKISAWVAIVAVPTMVAGIYGMNFEHMPELGWRYGYPFVLAMTAVICVILYRNFKHRGWL
jgi:magnesium transporter